MAALNSATEHHLRKLAKPRGAKDYAAWLIANAQESGESERVAEAEQERRRAPGYGLAGEALYGRASGQDGYAAYLQAAAKEALRLFGIL